MGRRTSGRIDHRLPEHGDGRWRDLQRRPARIRRPPADDQGSGEGSARHRLCGAWRSQRRREAVALAASASGPYVELDAGQSATERSYPLARPVYAYYTIDNDKTEIATPRASPLVSAFLNYVLSKQGQQAVEQAGAYLPLSPAVASEQRRKIDFDRYPPSASCSRTTTDEEPNRRPHPCRHPAYGGQLGLGERRRRGSADPGAPDCRRRPDHGSPAPAV